MIPSQAEALETAEFDPQYAASFVETSDVTSGVDIDDSAAEVVVELEPKRRQREPYSADPLARGFEEDEIMTQYLTEIGRKPLLTALEERDLYDKIQAGKTAAAKVTVDGLLAMFGHTTQFPRAEKRLYDVRKGDAAKKEFVEKNLRLVVSIAKKHRRGSTLPILDRIQEGNFGLDHAVDMFDARKGFKFSTYATWWIKQYISRAVMNKGDTIRFPVKVQEEMDLLDVTLHMLRLKRVAQKNNMPVTYEELADEVDWKVDKVKKLFGARKLKSVPSLNKPLNNNSSAMEDSETDLEAMLGDPVSREAFEEVEDNELRAEFYEQLRKILSPDDIKLLLVAFNIGTPKKLNNEEKVAFLGVTRNYYRNRRKTILDRLRHPVALSKLGSAAALIGAEHDVSWVEDAACRDENVAQFFSHRGRPSANVRRKLNPAEIACATCPVRKECIEYAEEIVPRSGYWAGVFVSSRSGIEKRESEVEQQQAEAS